MSEKKLTTTGLVLKRIKLRENDQILTLLTPEHGIVSASARGSLRPAGKLFSASGLYTYAEWTLFSGKSMYSVNEASPIELFDGLARDFTAVSVAAYLAELVQIYQPTGAEAGRLLRLALNCLHLLALKKREPRLVKAVFELRGMAETGFMPNLLACGECGRYEGGPFWFDVQGGGLLCGECAESIGKTPNINEATLAALRYIVLCEEGKEFGFRLEGASLPLLCGVAEAYALCHMDYAPKTLAYLKILEK